MSFKAGLNLVKPCHPSASFRLPSHSTEGKGRSVRFYVPLWFLLVLKTLTDSGMVLELLCVADSGRIAGAVTTVLFPSGKLLPESSEAISSECYLGLQHINLDKHSINRFSVLCFQRVEGTPLNMTWVGSHVLL